MALLLPKLRSHFAEFLNNTSPAGLRILSSSTCVGLRYGYLINNSGFSRHILIALRYFSSLRIAVFSFVGGLPPTDNLCLHRAFLSRLAT